MNDEILVPLDLADVIAMIDRQKQEIAALTTENEELKQHLQDDRTMHLSKTEEIVWHCHTCHWIGIAKDMTSDFCCPQCGEFKKVRIIIFPPSQVISSCTT